MRPESSARDRAWLEGLFDRHSARLRAFAARRVGVDACDDVVSEVFAAAWRRRRFVPDDALGWLFQTARHVVLHQHRGRARRAALDDSLKHTRQSSVPSAEDTTSILVEAVLDELPPSQAEILRLSVWDELTPSEIAQVLGLSVGATRTRLMRARKRAQQVYETALADAASPKGRAPTTPPAPGSAQRTSATDPIHALKE